MRTEFDFLPPLAQSELELIVEILFQGLRSATQNATGDRKNGRILKIILFGSNARGDWVEAPQDANRYRSGYDILVIVNQRELTDRATYWEDAEHRIRDACLFEKVIRTPANFIVHSLQEVNDALAHGQLLFMEIVKSGVVIHQSDDRELREPIPKSPTMALEAAQDYFEEWFPSAGEFFDDYRLNSERGRYRKAAFELHQATERLYHCVNSVLTFHTPHDHNLAFLRQQSERLDERIYHVWPRKRRAERDMFDKLRNAYVKARYSKHYRISQEELYWLGQRVEALGRIVHEICSERIAKLRIAVEGSKG